MAPTSNLDTLRALLTTTNSTRAALVPLQDLKWVEDAMVALDEAALYLHAALTEEDQRLAELDAIDAGDLRREADGSVSWVEYS